jgi:hypothetical protein
MGFKDAGKPHFRSSMVSLRRNPVMGTVVRAKARSMWRWSSGIWVIIRPPLSGMPRGVGYFPRLGFLLLLPALLRAMATACFCGLPALISVLMFELMVL